MLAVRLSFLAWLAFLIGISISPLSFKLRLHTVGRHHDFDHYLAFAITGTLLWLAFERWPGRVLGFLFGITFSVGQEWLENLIYHAGFEYRDVGTDLAGLVSGYAAMMMITVLLTEPGRESRPRDVKL